MAIARYKAVKVFEYEGVEYGLGNQLVLDPADAQPLVEKGQVTLQGYLDPEDPKDAAQIERIKRNPRSFNGVEAAPTATAAVAEAAEGDACEVDGEAGTLQLKRGKLVCVVTPAA